MIGSKCKVPLTRSLSRTVSLLGVVKGLQRMRLIHVDWPGGSVDRYSFDASDEGHPHLRGNWQPARSATLAWSH